MTYIPIIKTKQNVEQRILEKHLDLFTKNRFIPYLEILNPTKEASNKTITRCRDAIACIQHFEQYTETTLEKNLEQYKQYKQPQNHLYEDKTIFSLPLTEKNLISQKTQIEQLIKSRQAEGKATAFRIASGTNLEEVRQLLAILNANDWLIIDLAEQDYSTAEFYLSSIAELKFDHTVIFSTERHKNIRNGDFSENDYDYATEEKINTSLLDMITSGQCPFSYFGTHMGLKDTKDNEIKRGSAGCSAIFLTYNHKINRFYVLVSEDKDFVGRIYNGKFKEKVRQDYTGGNLKRLFIHDRASQALQEILQGSATASKFIYVSVLHYLEEIAAMCL